MRVRCTVISKAVGKETQRLPGHCLVSRPGSKVRKSPRAGAGTKAPRPQEVSAAVKPPPGPFGLYWPCSPGRVKKGNVLRAVPSHPMLGKRYPPRYPPSRDAVFRSKAGTSAPGSSVRPSALPVFSGRALRDAGRQGTRAGSCSIRNGSGRCTDPVFACQQLG